MWTVIFEDDDFLAVDKPEGLPSIPGGGTQGSLRQEIEAVRGPVYVAHRLDRDVSGIIVFAKTASVHRHLSAEFEARRIRKSYQALVHGLVVQERGLIERRLREFGSGRVAVDRGGKPSVTEFEVIERLANMTLLEVRPRTGRRHQIRAHLYSVGHPIVGDRRYGDRRTALQFSRLMLHSWRLALTRPEGAVLELEAPPPEAFRAILAEARRRAATRNPG